MGKQLVHTLLLLITSILITENAGQISLIEPQSRSTIQKIGLSNSSKIHGISENCEGPQKCGICGNVQPDNHYINRNNTNGITTRTYTAGEAMTATIETAPNLRGYFKFRVCQVPDSTAEVTEECLEKNVLRIRNSSETRFHVSQGRTNRIFNVSLRLPQDLACTHCVFQLVYKPGCEACQEYRACADIAVVNTDISTSELASPRQPASKDIRMANPIIEADIDINRERIIRSRRGYGDCKAVHAWKGQIGMDTWCNDNCYHNPSYCPSTHCDCSGNDQQTSQRNSWASSQSSQGNSWANGQHSRSSSWNSGQNVQSSSGNNHIDSWQSEGHHRNNGRDTYSGRDSQIEMEDGRYGGTDASRHSGHDIERESWAQRQSGGTSSYSGTNSYSGRNGRRRVKSNKYGRRGTKRNDVYDSDDQRENWRNNFHSSGNRFSRHDSQSEMQDSIYDGANSIGNSVYDNEEDLNSVQNSGLLHDGYNSHTLSGHGLTGQARKEYNQRSNKETHEDVEEYHVVKSRKWKKSDKKKSSGMSVGVGLNAFGLKVGGKARLNI